MFSAAFMEVGWHVLLAFDVADDGGDQGHHGTHGRQRELAVAWVLEHILHGRTPALALDRDVPSFCTGGVVLPPPLDVTFDNPLPINVIS